MKCMGTWHGGFGCIPRCLRVYSCPQLRLRVQAAMKFLFGSVILFLFWKLG